LSSMQHAGSHGDRYPEYSNLLRRMREQYQLSANEMAERLHVAPSTYRLCETGKGTPGPFERLEEVFTEADAATIREAWERERADESNRDVEAQMLGRRRSRARRKLEGTWFALWETTADGDRNFNRENLSADWAKGDALRIGNEMASEDNPKGGYVWIATLHLHDNCYLMGTYVPLDPEIQSRGTMFGVVHRSGRSIKGIWAGCNYDSELSSGHFVFSRSAGDLPKLLGALIDENIDIAIE
jgi:transcriptional regulator with XRE-family HTH domain